MIPVSTFFKDLYILPKHLFARKYLAWPFLLFFCWTFILMTVELIVNRPANLKTTKGSVIKVQIKNFWYKERKLFSSKKTKSSQLRIYFKGGNNYYFLTESPKVIEKLARIIHTGDKVEIKSPKNYYKYITKGHLNAIYYLQCNNKILFTPRQRQATDVFGLIVSSIMIVFLSYKIKQEKASANSIAM